MDSYAGDGYIRTMQRSSWRFGAMVIKPVGLMRSLGSDGDGHSN
jgi:hypothetical protein